MRKDGTMAHSTGGAGFSLHSPAGGRLKPAPPVRWFAFFVGIAFLLTACGTNTPTVTPTAIPTATPAATATRPASATATAAPTAATRGLPDRTPDKSAGARSDGWILDSVTTERAGGQVALVLRFQPLPGAAGGPQVDAWFQIERATYTLAVRGVRGS